MNVLMNMLGLNSASSSTDAVQIDQENDEEELKDLLLVLQDPKKIENHSQVYEQLIQFLPHIGTNEFKILISRLPGFLDLTSALSIEQYHLAIGLGEVYLRQGVAQEAITCFVKAVKIAEFLKNNEFEGSAHLRASNVLLNQIQSHFLTPEQFKNKLNDARSKGEVDQFGKYLDQIHALKRYVCDKDGIEYILALFKQGRDVLNDRPGEGGFAGCGRRILDEQQQPFKNFGKTPTERYHQGLKQFRVAFETLSKMDSLREFQRRISQSFRAFFQVLCEDAFVVLGAPPCAFDIRAIGSIGREEPSIFSDLECFVLIENKAHLPYFKQLLQFLELQILFLGETAGKEIVFTCLGPKNRSGFHLDTGGNPLAHSDLLGTLQELASLQTTNLETIENPISAPANQVLKSASLLSQENSQLFSLYQESVNCILDENESGLKRRQARALQFFSKRMDDFGKQSILPHMSNPLNIKEQYVQFLNFLLADLSLYFGTPGTNTLDIIDELVAKKVFSTFSGILLKEAVETLYRLRERLHQFYNEQSEEAYLDGLKGCVLTTTEKMQLETIYWLVLRPLYKICLPAIVKEKKTVEEAFDQVDLLIVAVEEMLDSAEDANFYKPLIKSLISHLAATGQGFERHFAIFKRISTRTRTHLEGIRQMYFDELETSISKLKTSISSNDCSLLLNYPNPTGARLGFTRRENELCGRLRNISTSDPHSDPQTAQIKVTSSAGIGYLKPWVIHEILEEETGDLKIGYPTSAHRVVRSKSGLHFKQKPMHPLMEYAINSLFSRIAGELTPSTVLVRFEVKGKMYPVLISTTIEGNILKGKLGPLSPAKWARWTWMLLCSILTKPGDGRPSNYVIDAQRGIFCIDNDISFVEPVVKNIISSTINFCCALFCFFQDRPLDLEVIGQFCSLDVNAILLNWIEDVIQKEEEYLKLFSEEERKVLLDEDPENRFKATILFREGVLATLKAQFTQMQKQLLHLQKKGTITPLNLLTTLISPRQDHQSGEIASRAYQNASQPTLENKLKWITSRSHGKSLSSRQADLASFDSIPTLEEVEKKKRYSPSKAREELCWTILSERTGLLSGGVVERKNTLKANFIGLKEDRERQALALKALLILMNVEAQKVRSVTIQNCSELNTAMLTPFLHPHLEYLDLSDCAGIQNKDIQLINKLCPNLKRLQMAGCTGITAFAQEGYVTSGPLTFDHLESLSLDRCPNLRTIRLKSKSLTEIDASENAKLSGTSLLTPYIKKVNFHNSPNHVIEEIEYPPLCDDPLQNVISRETLFVRFRRFKLKGLELEFVMKFFKYDRSFNLEYVRCHPAMLKHVVDEFKNDEEIVRIAVSLDGCLLQHASPLLRNNQDVAYAALRQSGTAFQYLSDQLKCDMSLALTAFVGGEISALQFMNNEVALQIVRRIPKAVEFANRDVALIYVRENPEAFKLLTNQLQGDKEILLEGIGIKHWSVETLFKKYKNDRDFVLAAVRRQGSLLKLVAEEFKKDGDIVLAAVEEDSSAFIYAHEECENDEKIVLAAFRYRENTLLEKSNKMRGNRNIVLAAVQQKGRALQYASPELQDDIEVVSKAVEQDGKALQYASQTRQNDIAVVLKAVRNDGDALQYASKALRKNRTVVMEAMLFKSHLGKAFRYAGQTLKNDREFVLEVVRRNVYVLRYASQVLKNDREIVLAAVNNDEIVLSDLMCLTPIMEFVSAPSLQSFGELICTGITDFSDDKEIVLAAVRGNRIGSYFKGASGRLKNDKEVVLPAVNRNANEFQYASDKLKDDRAFVLDAIQINGRVLRFASDRLKSDKELVLAALKKGNYPFKEVKEELFTDAEFLFTLLLHLFSFIGKDKERDEIKAIVLAHIQKEGLWNDIEFVLLAVSQNAELYNHVSQNWSCRKEVVLATIKRLNLENNSDERYLDAYGQTLVDHSLRSDKLKLLLQTALNSFGNDNEVILATVKFHGWLLSLVSDNFKNDVNIVLAAVSHWGPALEHANVDLKNNEGIVMVAVQQRGKLLKYASADLQNNMTIVMTAVQQDGNALEYASADLKNNKDIVKAAVKKNGKALQYASTALKSNEEIVMVAVEQNGEELRYAGDDLKNNERIVKAAVQQNGMALEYASIDLKNNENIVMAAVEQNGKALEFAKFKTWENKKGVLIAAMRQNGRMLAELSKKSRDDEDIVLAAVQQYGTSLYNASDRLKNNRTVVLAAVQQYGLSLQFASDELKDNKDIGISAVQQHIESFKFLSDRLKRDVDILLLLAINDKVSDKQALLKPLPMPEAQKDSFRRKLSLLVI